ncbi:GNAT family N-acetyltransferase [bacterium]|nr:GNAT family N-acetyltransferase [bacterium]
MSNKKAETSIRKATSNDHEQIQSLSRELGYDLDPEIQSRHLNHLLNNSSNLVLVAEMESQVIGFIHAYAAITLTSTPFIEIAALIVGQHHQGQGVGRALVQAIETSFPGFQNCRVRCNIKREEAHQFYKNLAYSSIKRQEIFQKSL